MVGLNFFKQVVSCCLILGGLQLHSLYGQAENLDNVSTQNLVNKMKAMLGNGDLYGAIPYLNEFKKRAKDGEFDVKKLDKIDYFIGIGFMKGYSEARQKPTKKSSRTIRALHQNLPKRSRHAFCAHQQSGLSSRNRRL